MPKRKINRVKKTDALIHKTLAKLDISSDALLRVFRIEVIGTSSILIENHGGVLKYSPEEIQVSGKRRIIVITGQALRLGSMDTSNLIIEGEIENVNFV